MRQKRMPSETKFCPKCKEIHPIARFYFNERLQRYDSWCRTCHSAQSRIARRTNYTRERGRMENLKYNYGITVQQYEEMFVAQGGVCLVCGQPETVLNGHTKEVQSLHVDHCHKTGRVRGLLCQACNTAFGAMKEDPERIRLLLAYALKQKEQVS